MTTEEENQTTELATAFRDIKAVTASEFIAAMTIIWDEDPNDLYEKWHNARDVALAIGGEQAAENANVLSFGDPIWLNFTLPGGGLVKISTDGGMLNDQFT